MTNILVPPVGIQPPKGRDPGKHIHYCYKCGKHWEHDDPCHIIDWFDCEDCRKKE